MHLHLTKLCKDILLSDLIFMTSNKNYTYEILQKN